MRISSLAARYRSTAASTCTRLTKESSGALNPTRADLLNLSHVRSRLDEPGQVGRNAGSAPDQPVVLLRLGHLFGRPSFRASEQAGRSGARAGARHSGVP